MLTTVSPRWLALLVAACVLLAPSHTRAVPTAELFHIERSLNRNVVRYDACVDASGDLCHDRPVSAYWVLEGGGRAELTWLERQFAYGFSISRANATVQVSLVACAERKLLVRKSAGRYRAELTVLGRRAILSKIWVKAEPGLLGPRVPFIELHATDLATGAPLVERIRHEPPPRPRR